MKVQEMAKFLKKEVNIEPKIGLICSFDLREYLEIIYSIYTAKLILQR